MARLLLLALVAFGTRSLAFSNIIDMVVVLVPLADAPRGHETLISRTVVKYFDTATPPAFFVGTVTSFRLPEKDSSIPLSRPHTQAPFLLASSPRPLPRPCFSPGVPPGVPRPQSRRPSAGSSCPPPARKLPKRRRTRMWGVWGAWAGSGGRACSSAEGSPSTPGRKAKKERLFAHRFSLHTSFISPIEAHRLLTKLPLLL
jgi:hypothetical protein